MYNKLCYTLHYIIEYILRYLFTDQVSHGEIITESEVPREIVSADIPGLSTGI